MKRLHPSHAEWSSHSLGGLHSPLPGALSNVTYLKEPPSLVFCTSFTRPLLLLSLFPTSLEAPCAWNTLLQTFTCLGSPLLSVLAHISPHWVLPRPRHLKSQLFHHFYAPNPSYPALLFSTAQSPFIILKFYLLSLLLALPYWNINSSGQWMLCSNDVFAFLWIGHGM